ncbi:unnamed protein product [Miscanthus lutarioriparius]|uniref:Uncharacterized protein n=1 Tax=Miscanthus lutarioriparius TaxID=422564 RepID=A0A811MKV9_9POAL|nr:unnamed protein product [Miscanthus lutarioriparius]
MATDWDGVGVGGPLIDLDGNFVGMNFYATKRTPFLTRSTITEFLVNFKKYRGELKKLDSTTGRSTNEIQESPATSKSYLEGLEGCSDSFELDFSLSNLVIPPLVFTILGDSSRKAENEQESSSSSDSEENPIENDPFFLLETSPFLPVADGDEFGKFFIKELTSQGYPLPAALDGGMRLVNTFENEFADDIWSKLTKKVAANMSHIVVSLASFNGEERIFVCTGIFVGCNESNTRILTSASLVRISDDENKINDNLKVDCCTPSKQTVGTLQHYHLHYNVAIVSIKGFRCLRTEEFHDPGQIKRKEVLSVGRVFKSGKLMATGGILTDKPSKLDCKELMVSTCRISKAGIGGPLIDCDGNFVGMNFYGRKETPYLPRDIIMKLLSYFDGKGDVSPEIMDNQNINSFTYTAVPTLGLPHRHSGSAAPPRHARRTPLASSERRPAAGGGAASGAVRRAPPPRSRSLAAVHPFSALRIPGLGDSPSNRPVGGCSLHPGKIQPVKKLASSLILVSSGPLLRSSLCSVSFSPCSVVMLDSPSLEKHYGRIFV